MLSCYKPLYYAEENELQEVRDYDNISVEDCFNFMQKFVFENLDNLEELFQTVPSSNNEAYGQENDRSVKRDVQGYTGAVKTDANETDSSDWGSGISLDTEYYDVTFHLFAQAVQVLAQKENNNLDEVCDPKLSKNAKIYQIVTNIVVGFLLPFAVIFATNLYIAYHIWKPAQRRLENSREMKHSIHRYSPKRSNQEHMYSKAQKTGSSKSVRSPVTKRISKPTVNEENEFIELQSMKTEECEQLIKTAGVGRKSLPALGKFQHYSSCELYRNRSSSFSRTLQHSFRNSTNSAESFPTDLTSLVTCSSPGLQQSKQAFSFGDDVVSA